VVAYRHIPDLGLITFATISQDTALAALWNAIITVLWLLVPIALMLLIFALVIARMLDTSERTQAKLAAALAHNDVLFREIHHRVKNNLQSVASLLQMQPIPREIKANMGQRIAAMSAVHEHIYRSNSFTTVRVKPYLETLIQSIRAGSDSKILVVEEIGDLSVDKDAATPLGLILNEVVANAFKHAFPEGRDGTIKVQLAATDDGRGRLLVEDDGVGFDPATPAKGIGQRLIKALTEQINGTSEMTAGVNTGSRFELIFPLAKS
jgi:two-component sensor histidine kinase